MGGPASVLFCLAFQHTVDRIFEVRGAVSRRFYWTGWEGWPDSDNTWEPERHFKDEGEDLVNDFWKLNTHLDRSDQWISLWKRNTMRVVQCGKDDPRGAQSQWRRVTW